MNQNPQTLKGAPKKPAIEDTGALKDLVFAYLAA